MPNRGHGDSEKRLSAFRDVGDHAALTRAGLFVAEGRIVVERLLEDGRFRVHSIAVTPAGHAAMALAFARRPDVDVIVCEPGALEATTGIDFHRGCLALAWRETEPVALADLAGARRILALEGVGNPDNVGGLFRTAFALGVDAVLLDPTSGDPLYRKAIRTSMAATLRLPFARVTGWPSGLDVLRAHGFTLVALSPSDDAIAVDEWSPSSADRLILAVGSEGEGLSDALMRYADRRVRIPIDPRADSLNVVVAAGIALEKWGQPQSIAKKGDSHNLLRKKGTADLG
jgi:tRNA G18 (ribose-2'-O)-methylase SpoU